MFDPASRYYALENAEYRAPDGTRIVYKKRRFLPRKPAVGVAVAVGAGERLDTISARTLGDPLLFWRIADANGRMNPFDLAEPGARLVIPKVRLGGTLP
jgi:hypothetical protein